MSDLKISMLAPVRRPLLFKKNFLKMFKLADHPRNIEWVIRIDDDDHDSIRMFKTDKKFKNYFNVFVGPRVGFWKWNYMLMFLCDKAKGDIMITWGDDSYGVKESWDSYIIDIIEKSKEPTVLRQRRVGGVGVWSSKNVLKEIWPMNRHKAGDQIAMKRAMLQGYVQQIDQWCEFRRVVDVVKHEGRYHEWVPDSKIIDNMDKLIIRNMDNFTLKELLNEDPNEKYRTK